MLEHARMVLSAFRPTDFAVSPTDLAKRAGLSKATGHRNVRDMLEIGYLERAEGGVRLGLRMFELEQMACASS